MAYQTAIPEPNPSSTPTATTKAEDTIAARIVGADRRPWMRRARSSSARPRRSTPAATARPAPPSSRPNNAATKRKRTPSAAGRCCAAASSSDSRCVLSTVTPAVLRRSATSAGADGPSQTWGLSPNPSAGMPTLSRYSRSTRAPPDPRRGNNAGLPTTSAPIRARLVNRRVSTLLAPDPRAGSSDRTPGGTICAGCCGKAVTTARTPVSKGSSCTSPTPRGRQRAKLGPADEVAVRAGLAHGADGQLGVDPSGVVDSPRSACGAVPRTPGAVNRQPPVQPTVVVYGAPRLRRISQV